MVPSSLVDTFRSMVMDDDMFNEAMIRCASDVVRDYLPEDEQNFDKIYDLANELCCRVIVS